MIQLGTVIPIIDRKGEPDQENSLFKAVEQGDELQKRAKQDRLDRKQNKNHKDWEKVEVIEVKPRESIVDKTANRITEVKHREAPSIEILSGLKEGLDRISQNNRDTNAEKIANLSRIDLLVNKQVNKAKKDIQHRGKTDDADAEKIITSSDSNPRHWESEAIEDKSSTDNSQLLKLQSSLEGLKKKRIVKTASHFFSSAEDVYNWLVSNPQDGAVRLAKAVGVIVPNYEQSVKEASIEVLQTRNQETLNQLFSLLVDSNLAEDTSLAKQASAKNVPEDIEHMREAIKTIPEKKSFLLVNQKKISTKEFDKFSNQTMLIIQLNDVARSGLSVEEIKKYILPYLQSNIQKIKFTVLNILKDYPEFTQIIDTYAKSLESWGVDSLRLHNLTLPENIQQYFETQILPLLKNPQNNSGRVAGIINRLKDYPEYQGVLYQLFTESMEEKDKGKQGNPTKIFPPEAEEMIAVVLLNSTYKNSMAKYLNANFNHLEYINLEQYLKAIRDYHLYELLEGYLNQLKGINLLEITDYTKCRFISILLDITEDVYSELERTTDQYRKSYLFHLGKENLAGIDFIRNNFETPNRIDPELQKELDQDTKRIIAIKNKEQNISGGIQNYYLKEISPSATPTPGNFEKELSHDRGWYKQAVNYVGLVTPKQFLDACIINNYDKVKQYFETPDADPNLKTNGYWTALHVVCNRENNNDDSLKIIQELLKYRADWEIRNSHGKTPLDYAKGKPEVLAIFKPYIEQKERLDRLPPPYESEEVKRQKKIDNFQIKELSLLDSWYKLAQNKNKFNIETDITPANQNEVNELIQECNGDIRCLRQRILPLLNDNIKFNSEEIRWAVVAILAQHREFYPDLIRILQTSKDNLLKSYIIHNLQDEPELKPEIIRQFKENVISEEPYSQDIIFQAIEALKQYNVDDLLYPYIFNPKTSSIVRKYIIRNLIANSKYFDEFMRDFQRNGEITKLLIKDKSFIQVLSYVMSQILETGDAYQLREFLKTFEAINNYSAILSGFTDSFFSQFKMFRDKLVYYTLRGVPKFSNIGISQLELLQSFDEGSIQQLEKDLHSNLGVEFKPQYSANNNDMLHSPPITVLYNNFAIKEREKYPQAVVQRQNPEQDFEKEL